MAHLRTRLARLEWREETVGPGDLDVGRHVRVGAGKGRSLDTGGGELRLECLALAAVLDLLSTTQGVALFALPFHFCILRGRKATLKVRHGNVKYSLFLFFLLLQLQSLRLEHGELRDGGEHLA